MRPTVIITDGGRALAGFKGASRSRDCGVRAVAIASGWTYASVHARLGLACAQEPPGGRRDRQSHPESGIHAVTLGGFLKAMGWAWTACMGIGTGCTVHVDPHELPRTGRHVLRLSRHYAAWVDGALHDSHDSSREGSRCVYGFWTRPD